jgi:outer membrane receptor protein involved in Fe transport
MNHPSSTPAGSCLLLAALFLLPLSSLAQSSIRGKVVTQQGNALAYANVLLLNSTDSSLVKGSVCSDAGAFVLDQLVPGQYLLMASMMGYAKVYTPTFQLKAAAEEMPMPSLVLAESVEQLQEVVVAAQRPLFEQQLDRMVVNVQSSIFSSGSTALDVLERSPGISVNRQSSEISLVGKQGVIIMINGKISRLPPDAVLQLLSGMMANNIEKIELITTPPASFDAEGNAGIINIVLRTDSEWGTNGSYTLSLGWGWYEKPSASINLNRRTQRLNLFGDYALAYDHLMQRFEVFRSFQQPLGMSHINTISNREAVRITHNARLGLDYQLSPKTIVGGIVSGFSNRWDMDAHNTTSLLEPGQPEASIWMYNKEVNHWLHWMGNLSLRHNFNDTRQLSLDLDYLYYHDDNPHAYDIRQENMEEGTVPEQIRISKLTPIRLGVIKLDYVHSLSWGKLEAGLKGTLSGLDNTVAVDNYELGNWLPDGDLSQQVHMREDIGAAYLNYQHEFSSAIKLQTGLRWEYTYTHLSSPEEPDLVLRRYGKFFPSVFLSKNFSEHTSLQLSYSRRITRPTYSDLAPFVIFMDPFTFLSGNTNLKAAFTDALQLGYQLKGNFMISAQYSQQQDAISGFQARLDPETNRQYATAENIDQINTFSLTLSLPLDVTPWWRMQYTLMGIRQRTQTLFQGADVDINVTTGRINSTQNFTLPKGFSAELGFLYQTPGLFGIATFKSVANLSAGVQKKLENERGTFRLGIDDIFWTMRYRIRVNQPELNLYSNANLIFEPRVLRLTYSRNFGNKNVKAAKRTTGSEEERNRVGN